jgi:hypothetical protein
MQSNQRNEVQGFDLLSQPAQQRLRARVSDAGGDIATVANEVRAELEELDQRRAATSGTDRLQQADRAFFVAQLTYLDLLAGVEARPQRPQRRGLLARVRSALGRETAVNS